MKYIVLQKEEAGLIREYPIIFPESLTHSIVAEMLCKSIELRGAKAVAAGSINSISLSTMGNCWGHSVSLKLKSRKEKDGHLIQMNDYLHGIVE